MLQKLSFADDMEAVDEVGYWTKAKITTVNSKLSWNSEGNRIVRCFELNAPTPVAHALGTV